MPTRASGAAVSVAAETGVCSGPLAAGEHLPSVRLSPLSKSHPQRLHVCSLHGSKPSIVGLTRMLGSGNEFRTNWGADALEHSGVWLENFMTISTDVRYKNRKKKLS